MDLSWYNRRSDNKSNLQSAWETFFDFILRQYETLPFRAVGGETFQKPGPNHSAVKLAAVHIDLNTTAFRPQKKAKTQSQALADLTAAEPHALLSAFWANPKMILLGKAGSGKSTFVRSLCLLLAEHHLQSDAKKSSWASTCPEAWTDLIPVPVKLGDLSAWMEETHRSSLNSNLLFLYLKFKLRQMGLEILFNPLATAIFEGRALLMLDGLNEVPLKGGAQRKVRLMLDDCSDIFPKTPILVTCRVLDYRESGQLTSFKWKIFKLAELRDNQIKAFVSDWYRHLAKKQVIKNPAAMAEELWITLVKEGLLTAARAPAVLTLMVMIFALNGKLSDSRAVLYEQIIDMLLDHWRKAGRDNGQYGRPDLGRLLQAAGLDMQALKRALGRLAFNAHRMVRTSATDDPTADVSRKAVHAMLVELQRNRSLDWADKMLSLFEACPGLLIETPLKTFVFPQRNFAEYLAACYIGILDDFPARGFELAVQGAFWREMILLAVGRMAHVDGELERPIQLIERLCAARPPLADTPDAWRNIWMAGKCLCEMGPESVKQSQQGRALTERVQHYLIQLVEKGRLNVCLRSDAGIVLGRLGDRRKGVGVKNGLADIDWIQIEAQTFLKGSDKDKDPNGLENEMPQSVCGTIQTDFYISRYPVTVAQYDLFVQADGYQTRRFWTADGWRWRTENRIEAPQDYASVFQTANHPRVGISWFEAVAFCRWLSESISKPVTLPDENQWELCARGADGRIYPWGNRCKSHHCNMAASGVGSTSAVGIFPAGQAACGAADVSGNVWEWCRTRWFSTYPSRENPEQNLLEGAKWRVLRGGSFDDNAIFTRCACRNGAPPFSRGRIIGFRLAASNA